MANPAASLVIPGRLQAAGEPVLLEGSAEIGIVCCMRLPFFRTRSIAKAEEPERRVPAATLEQQKAEVLRRMRIVNAAADNWAAMFPENTPLGVQCTRELLKELERPTSATALRNFIRHFNRTMVDHDNNLLGLEEHGKLPVNFAGDTYHALLWLDGLLASEIMKESIQLPVPDEK